ncbi:MAG TPA: hypothetical protein VNJ46_02720 [Gaiellaceae bacterium]|nr:hypothetical protein [Gaiellaceae bacterium]
MVSYSGPCGPAVTVSLASTRSSEPATELTPITLEHHERGRYYRKFFPCWQKRFVVYESRLDLPRVSIAALAAEAYLPFSGRTR